MINRYDEPLIPQQKKILDDYEVCRNKAMSNLIEAYTRTNLFIPDPIKMTIEDLEISRSRRGSK